MGNTTFQEDESRCWSVSFVGGIEIFGAAPFILESTPMEFMHSSEFYGAVAKSFPIWLIALSPAFLRRAGPATTMAGSIRRYSLRGYGFSPCSWNLPKKVDLALDPDLSRGNFLHFPDDQGI
jgi:hypothetical protein